MSVIDEIAAERRRQIEVEGWTPEHDDEHGNRQMAQAAACYAEQYVGRSWVFAEPRDGEARYQSDEMHDDWPWGVSWWKPKSPRRDLIRAGALIVAEIERLDRMTPNAEANGKNGHD